MAPPLSQVFFPGAFQELFSTWKHFPNAVLCAGGTGFIHEQGKRVPVFPANIISLDKMEELKKIRRTERYLEIGAAVKLTQIINLGKIVPEALTRCIMNIADPQLRSQATIGGNLCFPLYRLDACVPMIALDAQYELRSAQSSHWVPAFKFTSPENKEILTRIRVPLDIWTFTWYRKFHNFVSNAGEGAILFIMKNEKNILTNIRILCMGKTLLRDKNSETMLVGKRLPLSRKDADAFSGSWKTYLSGVEVAEENSLTEITKTQIINFIKTMLRHISD